MAFAGLAIGAASGAAQAMGTAQAANNNMDMYEEQQRAQNLSAQREAIVETNAARKEGYIAALEQDAARATQVTKATGGGSTMGLRSAEQSRQGALSIRNAQDRYDAAVANYSIGTTNTHKIAQNNVNAAAVSPFQAFSTVATGAFKGIGTFA